jgi:hypothetical protein
LRSHVTAHFRSGRAAPLVPIAGKHKHAAQSETVFLLDRGRTRGGAEETATNLEENKITHVYGWILGLPKVLPAVAQCLHKLKAEI